MMYNIKHAITAVVFLFSSGAPLCAYNEVGYNNLSDAENTSGWGTSKKENYDIAINIGGAPFTGLDIKSIKFPVTISEGVSAFKIWLANTLDNYGIENAAIEYREVTPKDGYIELVLDSPYKITDEGVYAGYSFVVDAKDTQEQQRPVVSFLTDAGVTTHGFWARSSRTYTTWQNIGGQINRYIPFEAILGNVEANSAATDINAEVYAAVGSGFSVPLTITTYGSDPIESIECDYAADGYNGTVKVTIEKPAKASFLSSLDLSVALPPIAERCEKNLNISLTKINGQVNNNVGKSCIGKLTVVSEIPVLRPLVEEYTGSTCGFCPRGITGFDNMKKLYGDLFVGVTYHSLDPLSIIEPTDYPNPAPALPVAWINRVYETDPYFGDNAIGLSSFGLDDVWERYASRFTPVSLSVKAAFSDDNSEIIDISSTLKFVKNTGEHDYRMVYMLIANDLSDEEWFQDNKYSGEYGKWPSDLDWLVEQPKYINNMHYDDVVVLSTPARGIEGTLPKMIEVDKAIESKWKIDVTKAVSLEGKLLVQDKSKLHVVAAVVDAETGEILNSAMTSVSAFGGVNEVLNNLSAIEGISYYDIQGRSIPVPSNGIYIKVVKFKDGQCEISKVAL